VLVILFFILNAYDFFDSGVGFGIMILALIIGIAAAIVLLSRIGTNPKALQGTKGLIIGEVKRWDERKIEFSKMVQMMVAMMKMGPPPDTPPSEDMTQPSDKAEAQAGPPSLGPSPEEMMEKVKSITDDEMNASGIGPLGGPGTEVPPGQIDAPYGYPNIAMAGSSAFIQAHFAKPDIYSPPASDNRYNISPEEATLRTKGYTKNLGAILVGITKIDPEWIYSHRGVSELHLKQWGKEVSLDHKYAIVFAEEMDIDLIGPGPHTPVILEAMHNYAKGAFIGTQVANFIAKLGYSARANFGAHYDALMVPLAVDAGLGELSRMGYLISKEYGPRIRLSAVITDLPLITDKPIDIGVADFCNICKKCARCCPSKSIPLDDRKEVNGSLRWKLNAETCFEYWGKVGTDCAVCMRVCPWSHARTFPHKLIVEAVSRNRYARRIFNYMDDLFYGKKPRPKDPPDWANFKPTLISRPPTKEEIMALSGTWKLTVEAPDGTDTPLLIFREEDGTLRGSMDGKMGKPELEDIRVDENKFSFKAAIKSPMGPMKLGFGLTIDGGSMSGNIFSPMGPIQFEGEKQ
ncbi:reductive dehalogenase, partial [Thermodesulfobacteriota bacterium]